MADEKRTRRQFASEDKAEAVKRHLVGGEAVSAICEDLGVAPNQFYRWQKELFDHAAAAFEVKGRGRRPDGKARKLEKRVESLEAKLAHKDNVIAEITEDYVRLKKSLDEVVDFVTELKARTAIGQQRLVWWLGIARSKFYAWKQRYGKTNEHNGLIPRDFWLLDWEHDAIIDYFIQHPDEGYRRLTYMMMDADLVAVSPSTVYRTLKGEGLLGRRDVKPSKKGTGFVQPLRAHQEWHIDVTYINLSGTFYYLCSVLDGFSRYIVHWEIREAMKETDVELMVQKALEAFPGVHPKLISDNGPQFIAKDFKEFIRLAGMTHVRTSPYYPQSNGKQERMQGTVKRECIREKCPRTVEEARRWVGEYIERYNTQRLHSAIGYVTPLDMLEGRQAEIHAERDNKLAKAREQRRQRRQLNQLPAAM